ncbi:Mss4-like protein [Kalaharituber pfeilii]|nr:Mss4-like protein [Kalaharituber pfeilii]
MPMSRDLHGSCYCGRNTYTLKQQPCENYMKEFGPPPYVYYDNCADCRRLQAAPIVGWVKVPLDFFSHQTHPRNPAEAPESIYRLIESSPGKERYFCGFCGTHITYIDEDCRKEGWIEIALGSLSEDSLKALPEMGLKPDMHFWWDSGIGWFKEDIKGSKLGGWMKVRKANPQETVEEGEGAGEGEQ